MLHYVSNDQVCRKGNLLLLDVAASYANYNADLTRTIPVSGRFTRRQRQVYDAVLRVMRASIAGAVVGKLHRDWQKEAQQMMNDELLALGLLNAVDGAATAYAAYALYGHGAMPAAALGAWVHDWIWLPYLWLITVIFLYFPNGRLPGRRWAPLPWVSSELSASWAT